MRGDWKMTLGLRVATALLVVGLCTLSVPARGLALPDMVDYTNYPMFLNKTGPVNILFVADFGNFTLEAAYTGSDHKYPISWSNGSGSRTASKYAANVTVNSLSGTDLVAVSSTGTVLTSATTSAPADTFNSSKSYFGIFDQFRCYTYSTNEFVHASVKSSVSVACGSGEWDGNFLNWLAMRKQEMIYQALIGGRPLPAQANDDGSADTLAGAKKIGENGSTEICASNAKSCWRYVKFVPAATLTGRVPTTLPSPAVSLDPSGSADAGVFFGVGDGSGVGSIYVNHDATADPFDTTSANQYSIKVNLKSEPDIPSGTGNYNDHCRIGDVGYAGHRVCYQRERSWGLFQTLRTGANMRVGILYVNASTGKGGSLQIGFDSAIISNDYTNLRNEHTEAKAPLSEALYEGLCLFRKSQGPCYANTSGDWKTNYTSVVGVDGDPLFIKASNKLIPCCKNFVLMITPGMGVSDGDAPDAREPFTGLFSGSNLGVNSTGAAGDRLDDVAYYGRTHDLRSDLVGTQSVTFYAVNAMGGKAGAGILASAAKYGGFEDKDLSGSTNFAPTAADAAASSTDGIRECFYPTGSNLIPSTPGPYYSDWDWDSDANGTKYGDCIPDTYFDASEGGDIGNQIKRAIADIMKRASSGTAISVLASSSSGEGTVYQAYFFPQEFETLASGSVREVTWTGYVQGLWVDTYGNMREDTTLDGRLVYTQDKIVETCIDSINTAKFIRYDSNADGSKVSASKTCDGDGIDLRQMKGIWEGGKKLAMRDLSTKQRKIFTWVDEDNDGVVDSGEQKNFTTDTTVDSHGDAGITAAAWKPYLQASASGTFTAENIINYVTGSEVSAMRSRVKTIPGESGDYVWRLGDVINSTPTIIGPPQERFDILYGDQGYRKYAQRWKGRRLTAYVGANDGMLHAFNGGYFHRGDDPGSPLVTEHGYYTTGPMADDPSKPALGEELWGFIPYYLLPQLRWLAHLDYTHVSYVDLKVKATDVRIFQSLAASEVGCSSTPVPETCIHPDGWGTILIVGLRYGGSCGACTAVASGTNGGPALTYTADFNNDGDTGDANDTRTFYSGYVVLDVTDPDNPRVVNAYSASTLGLTTGYPTVVRVSPKDDARNNHANATWYMLLGSGQHGYDGKAAASANLVAVELVLPGASSRVVNTMPVVDNLTATPVTAYRSFMANPITYDRDLDFRSDVVYVGRTIDGGATPNGTGLGYWSGKMYRLTMGKCTTAPCTPTNLWGVLGEGTNRAPTEIVTQVPIGGTPVPLGPLTASPTVTLDGSGSSWVFFGSGRFLSSADKSTTRRQYLVGVKDKVVAGGCPTGSTTPTISNCLAEDLVDVSAAEICVSCASGDQVQGVTGSVTFSQLATAITAKDGWVFRMAAASTTLGTASEQSIVNPTLIGGAIFFPTFVPVTDVCTAAGNSYLYVLYYLTGTGYPDPILGVDGNGKAITRVGLGAGVASSVAIQLGAEPTGMAGFIQTSDSMLKKVSPKPPTSMWSQYLSWMSQRS